MRLHILGDDPEQEPVVLSRTLRPDLDITRDDFPIVLVTPGSDWAIGAVVHGVLNELTLYASPLAGLHDPAGCRWRRVCDVLDGVTGMAVAGDEIFLLTHRDAFFAPRMLAWFERGGVVAFAHIRGGGEQGKEWHEGGRKLNKEHTITDFIDCAEYLIAAEYTRPDRLAGMGTSAGGVPSSGALVRRPDLWAAMIMRVALNNALRFEHDPNGPPNVPEFGSVATEEGYRGLRIIDAYARVQDGVRYPAVLLTTGLNDPRVPVWQASKMAARLQAATTSGKPVLLRVEEHGGHGFGSTRQQSDEELADILAFLLQQFGVTA